MSIAQNQSRLTRPDEIATKDTRPSRRFAVKPQGKSPRHVHPIRDRFGRLLVARSEERCDLIERQGRPVLEAF